VLCFITQRWLTDGLSDLFLRFCEQPLALADAAKHTIDWRNTSVLALPVLNYLHLRKRAPPVQKVIIFLIKFVF
jgi:hypothetical protein